MKAVLEMGYDFATDFINRVVERYPERIRMDTREADRRFVLVLGETPSALPEVLVIYTYNKAALSWGTFIVYESEAAARLSVTRMLAGIRDLEAEGKNRATKRAAN